MGKIVRVLKLCAIVYVLLMMSGIVASMMQPKHPILDDVTTDPDDETWEAAARERLAQKSVW
jgi:hypothetical protein